MARLSYVGPYPSGGDDEDVGNRLQVTSYMDDAPVTRTTASSDVHDAALSYAVKTYVDNQDAQYALPSYYQTRDTLNSPVSSRGVANGAASLDSDTKIPSAQIPALGAGYLKGPFGPTAITPVSGITTTPTKFTDFHVGVQSVSARPLVYATILVTPSGNARPVIEARWGDSYTESFSYPWPSGQALGRGAFNDAQVLSLFPSPSNTIPLGDANGDGYPADMDLWVSLWIYDIAQTGTLAVAQGGILSASVWLMRTTQ